MKVRSATTRLSTEQEASQAAAKLVESVSKGRFVSGHGFSRAESAAKSTGPLGPDRDDLKQVQLVVIGMIEGARRD
jgi:hypothetical protein